MLPPVDPIVLEKNPKFRVLWQDLTTSKLTEKGETRDARKEKGWAVAEKRLADFRTSRAKESLIIDGLYTLSLTCLDLPPELRQTLPLLCALLSSLIPAETSPLLTSTIELFLENIDIIATHLSNHLLTQATHLASILSSSAPPTLATNKLSASPDASIILPALQYLTTQLSTLPTQIAGTTRQLADDVSHSTQSTHIALITALLTTIERVQHSILPRHRTAQSAHLALVAEGLHLKLQLLSASLESRQGRSDDEDEQVLETALKRYQAHLKSRRVEMVGRRLKAEKVLGGGELGALPEKWARLKGEEERLRVEIRRLKGEE